MSEFSNELTVIGLCMDIWRIGKIYYENRSDTSMYYYHYNSQLLFTQFEYLMSHCDQIALTQNPLAHQVDLMYLIGQQLPRQDLNSMQILSLIIIFSEKLQGFQQMLLQYQLNHDILMFQLFNYYKNAYTNEFTMLEQLIDQHHECLDAHFAERIIQIDSIINHTHLREFVQQKKYLQSHPFKSFQKYKKRKNEEIYRQKLYSKVTQLSLIKEDDQVYEVIVQTLCDCFISQYHIYEDPIYPHVIQNIEILDDDDNVRWWRNLSEIEFTKYFTKLYYEYGGFRGDSNYNLIQFHRKLAQSIRLQINLVPILQTLQGSIEYQVNRYFSGHNTNHGFVNLTGNYSMPIEVFNEFLISAVYNEKIKYQLNDLPKDKKFTKALKELTKCIISFGLQFTKTSLQIGIPMLVASRWIVQKLPNGQYIQDVILTAFKNIFDFCKKQIMKLYVKLLGKINQFEVFGDSSSSNITIVISGFLTNWFDMSEQLKPLMSEFTKIIRFNWYSSSIPEFIYALAGFFGALIYNKANPMQFIPLLTNSFDWTWFTEIHKVAKEAGYKLADILSKNYRRNSIKIIAHSLGTVVTYYCLEKLEKLSQQTMIQDILLMGGVMNVADWTKLTHHNVFGKIINTYSKQDNILWWFINLTSNPCGYHPILNHNKIQNLELDLDHMQYFENLDKIIKLTDFGNHIHEFLY